MRTKWNFNSSKVGCVVSRRRSVYPYFSSTIRGMEGRDSRDRATATARQLPPLYLGTPYSNDSCISTGTPYPFFFHVASALWIQKNEGRKEGHACTVHALFALDRKIQTIRHSMDEKLSNPITSRSPKATVYRYWQSSSHLHHSHFIFTVSLLTSLDQNQPGKLPCIL